MCIFIFNTFNNVTTFYSMLLILGDCIRPGSNVLFSKRPVVELAGSNRPRSNPPGSKCPTTEQMIDYVTPFNLIDHQNVFGISGCGTVDMMTSSCDTSSIICLP